MTADFRVQDNSEMHFWQMLFWPTDSHHGSKWGRKVISHEHLSRLQVSSYLGNHLSRNTTAAVAIATTTTIKTTTTTSTDITQLLSPIPLLPPSFDRHCRSLDEYFIYLRPFNNTLAFFGSDQSPCRTF